MPAPNFLVIGTGRSGTTSLHHYLAQHPDIFVPKVKSPSYYFCRDQPSHDDRYIENVSRSYFVRDRKQYQALFNKAHGYRAVGEVSPVYLNALRVPQNIANDIPHAKLIAIIRNPVERVWSRYTARRRDGLEPSRSLDQIITEERRAPLQRDDGYGTYLSGACCAATLARYLELFPSAQLQVHKFEDLKANPQQLLNDIFQFLGVDPTCAIDTTAIYNTRARQPSNELLSKLWAHTGLWRANMRAYIPKAWRDAVFNTVMRDSTPTPVPPSIMDQLTDIFASEIETLESLLNWDLKHWRKLGQTVDTAP